MLAPLQFLGRLVFGPVLVATFAGLELAGRGAFVAIAGAYFVFVAAQVAVGVWSRWQLQLARRRLARCRLASRH